MGFPRVRGRAFCGEGRGYSRGVDPHEETGEVECWPVFVALGRMQALVAEDTECDGLYALDSVLRF